MISYYFLNLSRIEPARDCEPAGALVIFSAVFSYYRTFLLANKERLAGNQLHMMRQHQGSISRCSLWSMEIWRSYGKTSCKGTNRRKNVLVSDTILRSEKAGWLVFFSTAARGFAPFRCEDPDFFPDSYYPYGGFMYKSRLAQ